VATIDTIGAELDGLGVTNAAQRAVVYALAGLEHADHDLDAITDAIDDVHHAEIAAALDALEARAVVTGNGGWTTDGMATDEKWRLRHVVRQQLVGDAEQFMAIRAGSGYALATGHFGWENQHQRAELEAKARQTDAFKQLQRCTPRWAKVPEQLRLRALKKLAANEPLDPNDRDIWGGQDTHANAILRRHGFTQVTAHRLSLKAVSALIDGQAAADREAGLDWTVITTPANKLDEALRRAHERLPIDLDDPQSWAGVDDKRHAVARKIGLTPAQADDLSRWALGNVEQFDAEDLRCWRIASATWVDLADRQLGPVERVERPVGAFITPAADNGWRLSPALSLEMIRLVTSLGGRIERNLIECSIPEAAIPDLLDVLNFRTLHAGPRDLIDSRKQLGEELHKELGVSLPGGALTDKRDRWGRLSVRRWKSTGQLQMKVLTFAARDFKQRLFGSVNTQGEITTSAAMDLGEAVQVSVERGLPLLLSTEAAGYLDGQVRVGRMKGRPGMLTITASDGLRATTRRVVAEQAVVELRRLKQQQANVTIDAGARQVLRMVLAKPLADDPVLLGRQRDIAAYMAVGSGVNASQVGTGKTVMTARGGLYHRAATTPRFRAGVVAEGRLLGQWRDELLLGAPARGVPPLAPNVDVLILDEDKSIAGQLRQWDRQLGDRAGVVLIANSILDRYPADLCAIRYHLLVADEALRYVNPATEAHRSLKQLRFDAAADCWLLTATPKGKSSEHLDVLVGLAVGDDAMIAERLNTREAGNLMDEVAAHRVRVNYGPHLVRVTRQDMDAWMPKVRPAQPLVIEADKALDRLLQEIRKGGREAYRRLLEVLRDLKTLQHGSETYRQALVELSRAQGVVLGNVGVYVDASVDPETLRHSNAALAQALVHKGLVHDAIRGGGDGIPTLRGIVAQTIAGVVGEEQVLVFAERVRCLHQLSKTLQDRHGIEAPVADGSVKEAAFNELKQRFVAGEFPVLLLSPVGQEGHNLQNASTLVHLDLPWLQTGLEQRVGRSARPGSKHPWVNTYIPYVKGAGIEHVVSVLAERGAEHHQILDSFEGVKASESTIANQLGAITGQVADSKAQAGYAGTAAKLRVAAAVFGV